MWIWMMKAPMEAGHGFRDCAFDAINIKYKKIFFAEELTNETKRIISQKNL